MKAIYSEKGAGTVNGFMLMTVVILLFLIIRTGFAGDCLLAVQLNDPDVRTDYDEAIAAGSKNAANPDKVLDPLTWHCLACHDGTIAIAARYRISDGTLYQTKSIETIRGAHPVGMDYVKFSMKSEYAPVETLPPNMVLMYGAVSCVTCHNLLGSNKMYHVVDNSSSGLCFSCHRK